MEGNDAISEGNDVIINAYFEKTLAAIEQLGTTGAAANAKASAEKGRKYAEKVSTYTSPLGRVSLAFCCALSHSWLWLSGLLRICLSNNLASFDFPVVHVNVISPALDTTSVSQLRKHCPSR